MGCWRHFEEIEAWPFMSASDRQVVMADLEQRRPGVANSDPGLTGKQ